MRRFLVGLGIAIASFTGCEAPGITEARVTNCWHHDYYDYTIGRCGGKDANPPYTTQWALMLPCSNGTVTSGWRVAGAWSVLVECVGSGRRVGSAYFLFR
jgi:hypothetical protein